MIEDSTMGTSIADLGEAPLVEMLSYLDAREICLVQTVCRVFRQNAAMAWRQMEKSPSLRGKLGQDGDSKARCCRFSKAQMYARHMEEAALRHYDYSDPEPTHVKCWCCRSFPNLEARAFRRPQKYEFFCRFSSRMGDESKPEVVWEGFRPAVRISFSGLSLQGVHEIFQNVKLNETFGTYMFQSSEQDFVTMCDVTDSIMVTVVAVEKAYPWRCALILATGGFHDSTTTAHDDTLRCFRFHSRMVRSHGIVSNEDYITAGFLTSTERLGDPLQDCRLVLEHQW